MATAALLADLGEEQSIVSLVVDGIDRGRVDDQEGRCVVAVKESRVGLGELLEIAALDMLLVADAALGDAVDQHIDGRLQIHDEIRLGRVDDHTLVDALIQRILCIVERDACEQAVLIEEIIRDANRAEEIFLTALLALSRPLE